MPAQMEGIIYCAARSKKMGCLDAYHLTTIEFGEVTYDDEFYALLKRENLRVRTDRCIKKTWYNGTYRLIAARPLSDPRALQ